jgi:hypothetical protein
MTRVDFEDEFKNLCFPMLVLSVVSIGVALFVFPENSNEATRESPLRATRLLRDVLDFSSNGPEESTLPENGTAQSPTAADAFPQNNQTNKHRLDLLGRMRNDLAALDTDAKGCARDTGFLVDSPARMLDVVHRIQSLARYTPAHYFAHIATPKVSAGAIVRAVEAVHDALIVRRPVWNPAFWNYASDVPLNAESGPDPAEALNRARDGLFKAKGELQMMPNSESAGPADLDVLIHLRGLDEATKLVDAGLELAATRGKGHRFVVFGRPGENTGNPAKKSEKKAANPKPLHNRKCNPLKWPFNILYILQTTLSSPASHFGFKRTLAYFLISIWAFLPETEAYFEDHHLTWLMAPVLVFMTPTVGASVTKSMYRLLATGIAIFWAYMTFLAAGGTTTHSNYVSVSLAMYAPLTVLTYYGQIALPTPFTGRIASVAYIDIALRSNEHEDKDRFADQRSFWLVVAIVGTMVLQIAVFPKFDCPIHIIH